MMCDSCTSRGFPNQVNDRTIDPEIGDDPRHVRDNELDCDGSGFPSFSDRFDVFMPAYDIINWDESPGGNVEHIADNGLTPNEVESVLNGRDSTDGFSKSTGRRCVFGWTDTGIHIIVVYELDFDSGFKILTPITAYEVDERTRG